jgi:hypothetical protein
VPEIWKEDGCCCYLILCGLLAWEERTGRVAVPAEVDRSEGLRGPVLELRVCGICYTPPFAELSLGVLSGFCEGTVIF